MFTDFNTLMTVPDAAFNARSVSTARDFWVAGSSAIVIGSLESVRVE